MSYTPGPWQYRGGDVAAADGTMIARVMYGTGFDGDLIAAAPDMLAALQEAARLLNTLTTDEYGRGGDKRIRDLLAATIARATGEA